MSGDSHRCAGASCPGLPWKASESPHPVDCAAPMPFADLAARERYGSDNLSHMSVQRAAFADGVTAERARIAKIAQAVLRVDHDETQAMIDALREIAAGAPRAPQLPDATAAAVCPSRHHRYECEQPVGHSGMHGDLDGFTRWPDAADTRETIDVCPDCAGARIKSTGYGEEYTCRTCVGSGR